MVVCPISILLGLITTLLKVVIAAPLTVVLPLKVTVPLAVKVPAERANDEPHTVILKPPSSKVPAVCEKFPKEIFAPSVVVPVEL